jgi:acyl-coenzyme A thioesterase PaaI-like protein
MLPPITIHAMDARTISGTVTFGRYFVGKGAAHGGAIALVFDDVLGRLQNRSAGTLSRTAYLHTDYRSITPSDTPLDIRAEVTRHEGRKWFVNGGIWHGDTLCAEAEGLFVELKPGQP